MQIVDLSTSVEARPFMAGFFHRRCFLLVVAMLVGVPVDSWCQSGFTQEGSEFQFPLFRHYIAVNPAIDIPSRKGAILPDLNVIAYYPDLDSERYGLTMIWALSKLDVNLARNFSNRFSVGVGFVGEYISGDHTLYLYSDGLRRRDLEFYTTTYGGKLFGTYLLSASDSLTLTYLYQFYRFRSIRGSDSIFLPKPTPAQNFRLEWDSIRKRFDGQFIELSGRENFAFIEYENRDLPDLSGGTGRLTPFAHADYFRFGGSFQHYFTFHPARNRLNVSMKWGGGYRQDFLSLFRLGSYLGGFVPQAGETEDVALPGYYFSELRASRFVLFGAEYSYLFNSSLGVSVRLDPGISRDLQIASQTFRNEFVLGSGLGLRFSVRRLPIILQYGYAPLARRGGRRGGNELFITTFMVF